jgi:hypothetical protein
VVCRSEKQRIAVIIIEQNIISKRLLCEFGASDSLFQLLTLINFYRPLTFKQEEEGEERQIGKFGLLAAQNRLDPCLHGISMRSSHISQTHCLNHVVFHCLFF